MSDTDVEGRPTELVLEFVVDAPVEKVWRAIERPDLRAAWLPGRVLTDAQDLVSSSGREVRFRMRDDEPPFVETTVTFRVLPGVAGGSILEITHEVPTFEASDDVRTAANGDFPPLMRAA